MNRSKLHLLWNVAAALLLSVGFASCSQDDMPQTGGTPLPDGKYPLSLTATVGTPQTRTGGKDEWQGGEEIAVSIGDYTGKYTMDADGNATAAGTPYYWQNTTPATVSAWYPYAEGQQTYDISDQSQGYAAFDFLYAETEGSYKSPVKLTFLHQMAKVSYTLVKGQGISDAELNAATVTLLGDKSVTVSGGKITAAPTSQTEEIKPCHDAPALSGSALMVPQVMTGKPLIKVSISGSNFIYTPGEGAANLQSGTHYIYTITVKKDGIEVSSVSASWNDEGSTGPAGEAIFRVYLLEEHGQILTFSENVTQQTGYLEVKGNLFTISYNVTDENRMKGFPITDGIGKMERTMSGNGYTFTYTLRSDVRLTYGDYAKAGDYYYSDGTWRPDYVADNGCIGIVFKSGAGESDDISAYGGKLTAIRGYVVALADAHYEAGAWGIRQRTESNLPSESSYTPKYNGYANTAAIRNVTEYATTDISKPTENGQYWAFKVASDYSATAPSGSSGWYLPSIGQLADIYNLPDRAGLFSGAGGTDFKSEINDGRYWSSTQKNGYDAWYYRFNGSGAEAYAKSNDGGNYLGPSYVRAVLTF